MQASAIKFFAERGYLGTSMSDLAEDVGLSKAAIYHHFESKEALLHSLIETLESDIEDLLLRAEGKTSLDRAWLLRAIAEVMDRHREVIGIVPKHMPGAASGFASRGENHQRRLLKLLAGTEPTSESILRARSAVKVLMLEIIPRPVDQSGAKSNVDIEILLKIAADTLGI
jgi:AcrR family transcriptional regulator